MQLEANEKRNQLEQLNKQLQVIIRYCEQDLTKQKQKLVEQAQFFTQEAAKQQEQLEQITTKMQALEAQKLQLTTQQEENSKKVAKYELKLQ